MLHSEITEEANREKPNSAPAELYQNTRQNVREMNALGETANKATQLAVDSQLAITIRPIKANQNELRDSDCLLKL